MARTVAATDRFSVSTGPASWGVRPGLVLRRSKTASRSHEGGAGGAFHEFLAEAALIVLGDDRPLGLVALVEEGNAEGEGDFAENLGVFRPGQHGTWRHDSG